MHLNIKGNKQGTDEWLNDRLGHMTASHAQAIATAGKGLETYIYNKMSEYYSIVKKENFTNEDIERGNELEAQARDVYEFETGNDVEEVGFVEIDKFTGFSPDGLIKKDGGIEIKCLNNSNHFKLVLDNKIPSKYDWQIQMSLFLSKRKWWDFVAYNPNFKENIITIRVKPDEKKFEKIKNGLEKGKELIIKIQKDYEK